VGHYGAVKLDDLRMGGIFQWPGPVHEGHGKCQPFVDERADGEQREALLKIMSGQDTEPMATMFAVFSSTLEKVYDPIFAKIDFNVDVEGRKGRYAVAGQCPLRALWGAKGTVGPLWDVLATWREKSAAPVTGKALDCGHFLQEERPQDVINELLEFFGWGDVPPRQIGQMMVRSTRSPVRAFRTTARRA